MAISLDFFLSGGATAASGEKLGKVLAEKAVQALNDSPMGSLLAVNNCHKVLYDSNLGKPQDSIASRSQVCKIMLFD